METPHFFCSPTEGHLVHLQVLAIIDKAAVDICIQVLCGPKFSTHSGKCLGVQLLDCKVKTRRRQWHPTPVLLPGKAHGRRSLVGCSPWGRYESDTTEQRYFHFSLSCIGEGNGNPLQCSCLENPRDGGAWWAAVYGVTQSRTRLKRLSSSTSSSRVKTIVSFVRNCQTVFRVAVFFTFPPAVSESSCCSTSEPTSI